MSYHFRRIALIGRPRATDNEFTATLLKLYHFLTSHGLTPMIESESALHVGEQSLTTIRMNDICGQCDCIIVVGGDGSFLTAARSAVNCNIPIIGINRGRLGFLTDISPEELEKELTPVLQGQFREEQRFLLSASVEHEGRSTFISDALNDIVLMPGTVPQMIEFEIFIDDKLVSSQRADGLIVATPTGSTAYALSGGGPILHPELAAIVLVPMFPHTLSSRPIVIDSRHAITISINPNNGIAPGLSCDGQQRVPLSLGSRIIVSRKQELLRLIHPLNYDYYQTLRSKLRWAATH